MRVRIAVLADYSNITDNGKLNVLGIFTTIFAPSEPIVHADLQLVLQFEFETIESGKKALSVALVDEDGHRLVGLDGFIDVPHKDDGEPVNVNSIFRFAQLKFPHYGCYEFRIALDGQTETIIPVAVLAAKTAPPDK